MSDLLATQSGWLIPLLAGLLLVSLAVIVWLARRGNGSIHKSGDGSEEAFEDYVDRTELEVKLAEQADRMRVISDVHDAAAATLTSLISQAEGARFTAVSDPQVASRAAEAIADSARAVLNDIRRVVNVSREGSEDVANLPSLVSIHDLFDAINQSGITVKFEESGEPFSITPSAELAIFRILQESLNNSRAHGGPGTTVKVAMSWSAQGLHVRVDDDGTRAQRRFRSPEDAAYTVEDDAAALVEVLSGRGMKEMQTRTETFGGVFSAHRVPGVGFSVSAAFPTLRFHNGIHGVNTLGSGSRD
ncbi:MAG: histidine kinase [Pontimonas sp.]